MSLATEQAAITIVSPHHGTSWLMEGKSQHVVRWESTGVEKMVIFLELYGEEGDENPLVRWLFAKGVSATRQSYSVALADIQGEHPIIADPLYRVRIVDVAGRAPDALSGFFGIVKEIIMVRQPDGSWARKEST